VCVCVCVFGGGGGEGAARVRIGILAQGLKVQRESRVRAGGGEMRGEQHTVGHARTLTHINTHKQPMNHHREKARETERAR
jgi:hypothetical protein